MPAADSQRARYRRAQLDEKRVNASSGRAARRSATVARQRTARMQNSHFSLEKRKREGGRGAELVPNVWWQAVARKSESSGRVFLSEQ